MFFIDACTTRGIWVGTSVPGHVNASYRYFNGPEDTMISLKKGQTIYLDYQSKVKKGQLIIKLLDPEGKTAADIDTDQKGSKEVKVRSSGRYILKIEGKKSDGSFDVKWKVK